MSFQNRSPLNLADQRRNQGSPLRQKSPVRPEEAPLSVTGGAAPPTSSTRPGRFDENLARMKKSCERIAAVLGLRDQSNGRTQPQSAYTNNQSSMLKDPRARNSSSQNRASPRGSDYHQEPPMKFTNMNNPSGIRHLPDDPPQLASGYKSLREKSPVR